ncbi:Transposon Ty3-I Gag-Pol polyprotein, partial [Taenia solium]|eukprot:TsM_001204100 transcript=TsM_001204100 gene=TsM_001204100
MVEASSKRYWWSSLTPEVLDFCRTCVTCSNFKRPHSTAMAPLQPMPTGFPGERVGIDIMDPLPLTKRGNRYILVMVEYFTKVAEAEAEAMKSQDGGTVASTFFIRWICQHGAPKSVHSDQGRNLESRLFTELCKTLGIAKTRTTPGHPQGSGQVERTNRTLVGLLKPFTKGAMPEDWELSLGRALLAYGATVHASTG